MTGARKSPVVFPHPVRPTSITEDFSEVVCKTEFFVPYEETPIISNFSWERDRLGRIRRRLADGTLRTRQFHLFSGNSCVSLTIRTKK